MLTLLDQTVSCKMDATIQRWRQFGAMAFTRASMYLAYFTDLIDTTKETRDYPLRL